MNKKYDTENIKAAVTRYFSRELQLDETIEAAKERLKLKTLLRDWAKGTHMVPSLMGGMVEESIGTPWNCSVQSESYWCQ